MQGNENEKTLFFQSQQRSLTKEITIWSLSNNFLKGLSIKFQRAKPTDNLGMSQVKPKDKTTTMTATQRLSIQW